MRLEVRRWIAFRDYTSRTEGALNPLPGRTRLAAFAPYAV